MNVVGYMFVLRIHVIGYQECDFWLSCYVLVIFVKMSQKMRIMIVMIFNELVELFRRIEFSWIYVFDC